MEAMQLLKSIKGMIRFRYKLYYSELRALLGGGSFIYSIKEKVKFVCTNKDYFSQIIFISNGHEKLEMSWCEKWLGTCKENSWIIDCGANIGFFSAYLAQTHSSCKIYAIEGNKNTFSILQHSLKMLDLHNVFPENAILADKVDSFYEIPDSPGREPWQQAKNTSTPSTKTLTLDGIIAGVSSIPDLVKIDCEGFEVKILKGASDLLSQCSTIFFVECNDAALKAAQTDRFELFEIFRTNNYLLYHLSAFDKDIPIGKEITNDFPSREFNFAAIPRKDEFVNRWNKVLNLFLDKEQYAGN